jgi:hypothetical protein
VEPSETRDTLKEKPPNRKPKAARQLDLDF